MLRLLVLTFLLLLCVAPIFAQTLSSQDRDRARSCGSGGKIDPVAAGNFTRFKWKP